MRKSRVVMGYTLLTIFFAGRIVWRDVVVAGVARNKRIDGYGG